VYRGRVFKFNVVYTLELYRSHQSRFLLEKIQPWKLSQPRTVSFFYTTLQ
jgi:hypothetical protein